MQKGKKIEGIKSKRNLKRAEKRKKGKILSIQKYNDSKKEEIPDSSEQMTCVMTLSEKDINEAMKQQHVRVNGILYDIPIAQFKNLIANKDFGMVKITLTKSKNQTPPSAPGTINVKAENKSDLVKWIKEHRPSGNEKGSPFLKLNREDCGCEFIFNLQKDIPKESLICEHGNTIIQYTK